MKTNIGISEVDTTAVVHILNTILSDEFILYTKTLNFHWNVYGPNFSELHVFFERQYKELALMIDEIAERVKAMGGRAYGSMTVYVECSRLEEAPTLTPTAEHMLQILLEDHESLIRALRHDIKVCFTDHGDIGTNNFLTDLLEKHEKMAWMLRASAASK